MDSKKKIKLLKYLFPTEKIRNFMCNDLYPELLDLIPKNLLISTRYMSSDVRKENNNKVSKIIIDFLDNNPPYKKMILDIYEKDGLNYAIELIILGLTFYLSNTLKRRYPIDIFFDKRSICYAPISVIDIL